jgi:hypothetical protein
LCLCWIKLYWAGRQYHSLLVAVWTFDGTSTHISIIEWVLVSCIALVTYVPLS